MVKLLELDEWPELSVFVGDEVTYNEILAIAEEIWGKIWAEIIQMSMS